MGGGGKKCGLGKEVGKRQKEAWERDEEKMTIECMDGRMVKT